MLSCIAVAGALYFHMEHNEAAGVSTSGSIEWERLIPVEGTTITRDTDHGNSVYTVWFLPVNGSNRRVQLDQVVFPNWSPLDLLEECDEALSEINHGE